MELPASKQEKIKLVEINQYLTCYLCKGYLIDATTISECLHSFCRSCIIQFLQDNSYCPVCKVIINKAKPNLKLDKTLQDIVYKLVPELFMKEMLRRKNYYKDYPEIAAKVSPEERGEDTERTIFNPHEMISLSLEYICDDSAPGAIHIPGLLLGSDSSKDSEAIDENAETQMKRYLLCPGMCRIEVLKKFVRNKYNVDTSQFFIDILYKRVPLPDHYTLIDIGYIYSWQRNELMKFFFRIVDLNNTKRTESPINSMPFISTKIPKTKTNGVKTVLPKRKDSRRKSVGKSNGSIKQFSDEDSKEDLESCNKENDNDRAKSRVEDDGAIDKGKICTNEENSDNRQLTVQLFKTKIANSKECKFENNKDSYKIYDIDSVDETEEVKCYEENRVKTYSAAKASSKPQNNEKQIVQKTELKLSNSDIKNVEPIESQIVKKCYVNKKAISNLVLDDIKIKTEPMKSPTKAELSMMPIIKQEPAFSEHPLCDSGDKFILQLSKNIIDEKEVPNHNSQVYSKTVTKSYTSITLNRSENVEIITQIEPLSNKDGHPIGHHIVKQTIKKGPRMKPPSPKKSTSKSLKSIKRTLKKNLLLKTTNKAKHSLENKNHSLDLKTIFETEKVSNTELNNVNDNSEDEKSKFFKSIELTAVSKLKQIQQEDKSAKEKIKDCKSVASHKRKANSPIVIDNGRPTKLGCKKAVKIILQEKISSLKVSPVEESFSRDNSLQSLIDSCKINIPSSLSITLKESTEDHRSPPVVPPVKNFIEILKLPDENPPSESNTKPSDLSHLKIGKLCDNDSEQKVDQDLSDIAKSLTEKIPMSTTISHIVGPKQQFEIPVTTNAPSKFQIQPAPVPELSKILNISQNEDSTKLTPKSPQTFQKIFEESLKKPPEDVPNLASVEQKEEPTLLSPASESTTNGTSQSNKVKSESEKGKAEGNKVQTLLPKIPISRLPHQSLQKGKRKFEMDFISKLVPQTVASLHSSSLGMNYTVSVGQQSPTKTKKANGIVSPVRAECLPQPVDSKQTLSPSTEVKSVNQIFKVPSPKLSEVSSDSSGPQSSQNKQSMSGSTNKRNILDIPSQLIKKTKKDETSPQKIKIPRWPRNKNKKFSFDTNLMGFVLDPLAPENNTDCKMLIQASSNLQKSIDAVVLKSEGTESDSKKSDTNDTKQHSKESSSPSSEFKVPSLSSGLPKLSDSGCSRPHTPLPKSSPKSSPVIKHMYTPTSSFPNKPVNRPKNVTILPKPVNISPKPRNISPKPSSSGLSPVAPFSVSSGVPSSQNGNVAALSTNEIMEKYNIPNLSQLTATFNINPSILATNQLAAFQQAMLLKHFEMQNRQNWLNRNQGPVLQYEKYLQNLNGSLNGS
ncbi:polycomb group protein Psc-like [Sitophilus oryzae]|uniref:Polycomb group protein Psc-like n=1 Tax=Sitophilus oryzae TaxID=7048 RepID=A0A6J2XCH5_SITOR|nr:polycomb group protein Psc-like [Sitophilus oryzae]